MLKNLLKRKVDRITFIGTIVIVVVLVAGVFYYNYRNSADSPTPQYKTSAEADLYVRFVMEAYDKISENYWMRSGHYKIHDIPELPEIFQLSLQKAAGLTQVSAANDRDSIAKMLATVFSNATSSESKKQLALQTVTIVTYNLLPINRNALFSAQKEIALRQEVNNINPSNDLYENLGIKKEANAKQIKSAYDEKSASLKKATTTQAKAELERITYAKNVLTNENSRKLYDQVKIEPTVFSQIIGKTMYVYLKQISPTTLQEFGMIVENASSTLGLNGLIIDLRGNIGGDLRFANDFLGLFIGPNQYAFDFFRDDNYQPERTTKVKFNELMRYKEVAVLTDKRTQSTAELTAAILKRLKIARVVGVTTAGWGTVENTYQLETVIDPGQKYSLYLVNNITLGDDNQPIEGAGVVPDVDISKSNWKAQLKNYFNSETFMQVLRQRVAENPILSQ